jgi:hypothetical protein
MQKICGGGIEQNKNRRNKCFALIPNTVVQNRTTDLPLRMAGKARLMDRSEKLATQQQVLIVNDLAGNTKGNNRC